MMMMMIIVGDDSYDTYYCYHAYMYMYIPYLQEPLHSSMYTLMCNDIDHLNTRIFCV